MVESGARGRWMGAVNPNDGARSVPRAVPRPGAVPKAWAGDIETVLLDQGQIQARVRELAALIEADYRDRDLTIVSLLNGTVMFIADLVRHLSIPLRLDFMGASSYSSGSEPGELVFTHNLKLDVAGREVLLVDDILDTGATLARAREKLRSLGAMNIRLCVFLDKKERRATPIEADYVGFVVPDAFVVGYGLDFEERYRHLPFVGVLRRPRHDGALVVHVLFHSYFKELAGCARVSVDLHPGATLDDLRARVLRLFPKLRPMERSFLMAVGVDYQPGDHPLGEGEEISFFPPVQGG